ncbi:MAG: hypothetical protein AAFU03_13500, partial [Bacteroidota bacterium]
LLFIFDRFFLLSFCLFLVLLLSACSQERDIRSYYFPVRELTTGQIYEYIPLAGPDSLPIYWYALGVDLDTSLILTITTYDPSFSPATLVKEKITNVGVITDEVRLYTTDSSGISHEVQANILAGNAFPFFLTPEERPAYVYSIRYQSPNGAETIYTTTYNRQFSRDTTITVLGKSQPALVFNLSGETDINDPVNGSMTPQFAGYEIYARGLGLVESYRDYDGFVFHQKLNRRLLMSEFTEMIKTQ